MDFTPSLKIHYLHFRIQKIIKERPIFLLYWCSFFCQCNCTSLGLTYIPIFARLNNVITSKTNRKKKKIKLQKEQQMRIKIIQWCICFELLSSWLRNSIRFPTQTVWLLFSQSTSALNIHRHKMYKKKSSKPEGIEL